MQGKILAVSEDGTILYQQLTPEYLEEAAEVIRKTLFTQGNINEELGVSDDPEAVAELEQLSKISAKDGVSVVAIDKNTNRVVGVSINKILIKSQQFYENFRKTFKNSKSRQIIEFIITIESIKNLFEHCQLNCLMEISFLGTLPEYRKKGIAKKLTEISIEIAQNLHDGINVKQPVNGEDLDLKPVPEAVSAIFTSFISQKIGRELGFEIAAERSSMELGIMEDEDLENFKSDTPTVTVEYKLLKKKK